MQEANILLALGGDSGNTVPKSGITPSEVAVLQLIHGNDAVTDIDITGTAKNEFGKNRTNREERQRLTDLYSKNEPDGTVRSRALDMLFPGVAARLYEDFSELDLDESLFKAKPQSAAKQTEEIEQEQEDDKDPLDAMTKAQLVDYAKANDLDVDTSAKKDDLLVAVKEARDAKADEGQDGDAGDNDGIGDMNDEIFK